MTELSVGMNEPHCVQEANSAHEVFLEKLSAHNEPDSDFPYWLSSATLNLCMDFEDVKLKDQLKHVDKLVKAVKEGFEQKHLLLNLSSEERERMIYSKKLFTKIFKNKPDNSKTVEASIASVWKESEEEVVQESTTAKRRKVMFGGKEEVKCAICRQSFKRPIILPCSHVFCMHCLEKTGQMTNKYPGDMMLCKSCEQEFKIPKEGFQGLENFQAVEFLEIVNRGHETFLKKLRSLKASDNSFLYWLSIAALNLCVNSGDVDLKGKLIHVDDLAKVVKHGFEQIKDLLDNLSEEDRAHLECSQAFFAKTFEGNPDERKAVEVTAATVLKESEEEGVQECTTFANEETECVICRESLKNPKTLPCSHVFCMSCLEETARCNDIKPGDIMPCGICRRHFRIPEEGFDGIEIFEAVEKVIEPAQVLDPSSKGNAFEACSEDSDLNYAAETPPAFMYCVDCKKKLCAECQRYNKKLLKTHEVQDFEDPDKASAASGQLTIKRKTGKIGVS